MKTDWKSIKQSGFPAEKGRYLVTMEGLESKERRVVTAIYFGQKEWGIMEGVHKVIAWDYLPEEYKGE